jgi:hypothetical protein
MVTTNKIVIGINDEVVELTGEAKETFLAERKANADARAILEAEQAAKQEARDSAIKKLGEIAGLTKEELDAIL